MVVEFTEDAARMLEGSLLAQNEEILGRCDRSKREIYEVNV